MLGNSGKFTESPISYTTLLTESFYAFVQLLQNQLSEDYASGVVIIAHVVM